MKLCCRFAAKVDCIRHAIRRTFELGSEPKISAKDIVNKSMRIALLR